MELRTIEPVRSKQAAVVFEPDQPVVDAYDTQAAATFTESLHKLALQTRQAIGAHQCAISFVPGGDFLAAVHTHSFSEKYEKYNTYDVMPTGAGIWMLMVAEKKAVRMTQEELVTHPMWKNFSDLRDARGLEHPPMRGWLAAPVLRSTGEVLGMLQLSDKEDDAEFTARDLDLLIHLASLVLPTFELQLVNRQLQERTRELQSLNEQLAQANKSVAKEHFLLNTLIDNIPEPVFLKDRQGRFLRANRAMAEDVDVHDPAELIGKTDADIWSSDFARETLADEQRIMETGTPIINKEEKPERAGGPERWVLVTKMPMRDESGAIVGLFGVAWDITKQKQQSNELQSQRRAALNLAHDAEDAYQRAELVEERLNLALKSSGVGTWSWNVVENSIIWDDFIHPLFGLAPGTFPGRYEDFLRLVHPDDQDRVAQEVTRSIEDDVPYESEFQVVWPEGGIHVLGARGKVYRDAAGRALQMTGVCWDLTQRRQTEDQLRHTSATLDRLVAQLAMPPREFHPAEQKYRLSQFTLTDMMTCGSALRSMSTASRSRRELSEQVVQHLYHHMLDDEGCRAFALVRMFETQPFQALAPELQSIAAASAPMTPQTVCLTLVATTGDEPAWNDAKLSQGHRAIPLSSAEAVEQLPMIAQLIRQLGLKVAGVITPVEGVVVNSAATGVFHIPEALRSPWIPAQEGFVVPFGIRSVVGFGDWLPDGHLFVVIGFSKVPISRETARLLAHLSLSLKLAFLPLVTSPRRTEAQIIALDQLLRNHETVVAEQEAVLRRQTEALTRSNVDLEQFAYVASHDLQEPLRKIQAFSNLLITGYCDTLGAEGQDYLERMRRAAERMQLLINDLLTLSRVTRKGEPFQRVDLNAVVRAVLNDLEARIAQTGGQVELDELPTVDADPTQMRQLFQNLIGNALKFHRPNEPPRVSIVCAASGDAGATLWRIEVRDNGIGFEPKYAEQIFQPFQRLHGRDEYEGTGMGLAICRRIVDRHHGTITAEGRPFEGATIFITLPMPQTVEGPSDGESE